jgi:hypothetical protein
LLQDRLSRWSSGKTAPVGGTEMSQSTDDPTRSELRAMRGHTAAVALHVEVRGGKEQQPHVVREGASSARLR